MSPALERRLLQAVILVAGFVPVLAGGAGMLKGAAMVPEAGATLSLDSHVRYLSGLLFGLGIAFWASIPQIERHAGRVRLLSALVVCGGLARLAGLALAGVPDLSMRLALIMELGVTPAIAVWQSRVARRSDLSL